MDVLTDDHEREQVVRKWWSENWKSLTLGIVIAIGGMVGYRQYQNYQFEKAAENASKLNQVKTALILNQSSAQEAADSFLSEHEDIYGALLSLDMAAISSAKGDYDKALEHAQFAAENGGDLVSPNAQIVQAQILAQLKKYDDAVNVLNLVTATAYDVEKNETLGDIYFAKGELDKAHDAYAKAIEVCQNKKIAINPLLQMKADNLIKNGETPAYKKAALLSEEIARSASEIKK